jgi:hypothetical protein
MSLTKLKWLLFLMATASLTFLSNYRNKFFAEFKLTEEDLKKYASCLK